MLSDPVIGVAVDDRATASAVATAAAHMALDQGAGTVILVHVCDAHTMVNAVGSAARGAAPIAESTEEGAQIRALAEAAPPQKAGVPLSLGLHAALALVEDASCAGMRAQAARLTRERQSR